MMRAPILFSFIFVIGLSFGRNVNQRLNPFKQFCKVDEDCKGPQTYCAKQNGVEQEFEKWGLVNISFS